MKQETRKTFRKLYPLARFRKRHPVTCPTHIFFESPWLAKECGFFSETYWRKEGREIKDNQTPAIVPLEISTSYGVRRHWEPVLAREGESTYYVSKWDLYWSQAQTQEKQKKDKKKGEEEGDGTGESPITLCYPNKRTRKPVSTGVFFSTPTALIIPDEMKHLENEIRYMIHIVIQQTWNRKHDTGGGRINSRLMADIVGNKEREWRARAWLCEQGILITDHKYRPGQQAKTYFLNPIYNCFDRWECTKKPLGNKVLLNRSKRSGSPAEALDATIDRVVGHDKRPVEEHLDRWLSELSIDLEACQSLGPENPNLETARAIANKEFRTSRCKYGRYHSAVTRLWTPYRHHLSWFGKRAIGLDVKNSHPVIMVKKMREDYWEKGLEFPADFIEFARLVECGTIYDDLFSDAKCQFPEYLVERKRRRLQSRQWTTEFHLYVANRVKPKNRAEWTDARERFGRVRKVRDIQVCAGEVGRSDFKVMVFADILFGRAEISNHITQLFASRFPSVAQWVKQQKAGSYKHLARMLQREESEIIIDTICEHLRVHHAEVPITAIHDSILTTEDFVPVVRRVMEKEYGRRGLHPTIKTEN